MTFANTAVAENRLHLRVDNSPPDPPSITIPDSISVGKCFQLTARVVDPDGDDVYIRFDAPIFPILPNFWFGPIPSAVYTAKIRYSGPTGTYRLGVQAKDIYDAESDWTYVQFNVTKVRIHSSKFSYILDNYPGIILTLQQLLYRMGGIKA
jgi:hypothetical protein